MTDIVSWIAGTTVTSLLIANLGFTWNVKRSTAADRENDKKEILIKIDAIQRGFGDCRLHCASTFATQAALQRNQDHIEAQLREVNAKLDHVIDRLLDLPSDRRQS